MSLAGGLCAAASDGHQCVGQNGAQPQLHSICACTSVQTRNLLILQEPDAKRLRRFELEHGLGSPLADLGCGAVDVE